MVWMAGDNDLESFGEKDLVEMKRVGSTDAINVIAQFDSMKDDRTRRYAVTPGGRLDADVVEELGETNTGDPRVAVDFFRWGIERYPADRILGVIWNHGTGIDDTDIYSRSARPDVMPGRGPAAPIAFLDSSTVRRALSSRHRRALFGSTIAQATRDRAIAFDDTSRDFLDNVELKKVLSEVKRQTGRKFDVVGFDACLMNMIEVGYQLKGNADVVVGSQELEPGDGWPYDRVLEKLAADPTLTGPALAAEIVDRYVKSYRNDVVTQSALNLRKLGATATAVDALAKALVKAIARPADYTAVARALNATQRFDTADFIDLGHFCQEIAKRSTTTAVRTAAKATLNALTGTEAFVLAHGYRGQKVSKASGASIYFPRGPVNKAYGQLDFARKTSWRTFLDAFHRA
jgi:hypothetical protein